jgi:hypothetical protein
MTQKPSNTAASSHTGLGQRNQKWCVAATSSRLPTSRTRKSLSFHWLRQPPDVRSSSVRFQTMNRIERLSCVGSATRPCGRGRLLMGFLLRLWRHRRGRSLTRHTARSQLFTLGVFLGKPPSLSIAFFDMALFQENQGDTTARSRCSC